MLESIRSYIRLSRLSKALIEAQQNRYTDQLEAMRACNRLFGNTGKEYAVVKHQREQVFWVVRTASAQALVAEGHSILKPYR